jgi:diguanylate cyclase (GGDEF)-like protein
MQYSRYYRTHPITKALARSEALLRKESTRDHLTGLFNRRYMEETLDREMARALRQNSPLSILVVDVDEFKHIKDIFGHAVADTILRKLSKMLLRHVRAEDIPSRYGGDDFIIVMPGASSILACERAERLCEHARHFHPTCDGQTLEKIILSIGVATYPKDDATSAAVLKAVDSALYHAKLAGRDQVKVTVKKHLILTIAKSLQIPVHFNYLPCLSPPSDGEQYSLTVGCRQG